MLRVPTLSYIAVLALAATLPIGTAQAKNKETVIYSFAGGSDGLYPWGTLITDGTGHLFGTTHWGGTCTQISGGCGVVYRVTPSGRKTTLHVFQGGSDGADPYAAPVTFGEDGNLYGTTRLGGIDCDGTGQGCGTVFKLTPKGKETVLYRFSGGSDGSHPDAGVIVGPAGSFYGTTNYGGTDCDGTGQGCGTVFSVSAKGEERIVYAFEGGSAGTHSIAGLTLDGAGNLYGTTRAGGVDCDGTGNGCGTVFKLTPDGKPTVLHTFAGGTDGATPLAAPILDAQGNLYGTTIAGGSESDFGVVYRVTPKGRETVLHAFTGQADGGNPYDALVIDAAGNLYGTASSSDGTDGGVVFRMTPKGNETVLHSFTAPDGYIPVGGLFIDAAGDLFGTTTSGGDNGYGTVFRIRN